MADHRVCRAVQPVGYQKEILGGEAHPRLRAKETRTSFGSRWRRDGRLDRSQAQPNRLFGECGLVRDFSRKHSRERSALFVGARNSRVPKENSASGCAISPHDGPIRSSPYRHVLGGCSGELAVEGSRRPVTCGDEKNKNTYG